MPSAFIDLGCRDTQRIGIAAGVATRWLHFRDKPLWSDQKAEFVTTDRTR